MGFLGPYIVLDLNIFSGACFKNKIGKNESKISTKSLTIKNLNNWSNDLDFALSYKMPITFRRIIFF